MANPWLRLYGKFANDPNIQMMSEAYQRRFIMLLCMKCNDNATLQDAAIAFQCRITQQEWVDTKAEFIARKLIDEDNNILGWDKKQYVSDSSTERSRRCRERKKQTQQDATEGTQRPATKCNVAATPPDTDSDTETDTKKKNIKKKKSQLPDGWKPKEAHYALAQSLGVDCDAEAKRFEDYHKSKASLFVDWDRAFNTWLRQAESFGRGKSKQDYTQLNKQAPENMPSSLAERLRKTGMSFDAMHRAFNGAVFEDGGKKIIVATQFLRDHMEQKYSTQIAAALGQEPQIEVRAV